MKVIGVTGMPGSGKTALCREMANREYPLFQTDEVAREERAKPEVAQLMREAFPEQHPDGEMDTKALAELIFSDPDAKRRAEAIIHPRVRSRLFDWLDYHEEIGTPAVLVECAILYETNMSMACDKIVCVSCDEEARQNRLIDRGWTPEHIAARDASQMHWSKKVALADAEIHNDSTVKCMADAMEELIRRWIKPSVSLSSG